MHLLGKLIFVSVMAFSNTDINTDINEIFNIEKKDTLTLTVELNDASAVEAIKQQLIEEKYKNNPELVQIINLESSEMIIEGLDVSKLGTQDVMISFKAKSDDPQANLLLGSPINEKIRIVITDTTAPTITLKHEQIWLDHKEELEPLEWIETVSDNDILSDLKISADTSELNIQKAGNYEVIYSVQDNSGNSAETVMTVTVREEKKAAYTHYGTNSALIETMLNLINETRSSNGLKALELGNEDAQAAAGVRACEAAAYVSHTRPDGRHYKTAFNDYGVSYSSPYEILTYSGTGVQDKFDWWMNSDGHRRYILHSSSNKIAIGYCGKMWSAIIYSD